MSGLSSCRRGICRSGRDPDDRVRAEHGFEAALQAGLQGHLPRCGKNLNEGACSCRPEIDPRLAVLGQLLKDK